MPGLSLLHDYLAQKDPSVTPEETKQATLLGGSVNQIQAAAAKNSPGMQLLEKVNSGTPLTKGEMLAMLAATVLPVIAGSAIGGKKGALHGAKAGFQGSLAGLAVHQAEDKAQAAVDLKKADVLLDQEKEGRSLIAQLAKEERAARTKDEDLMDQAAKEIAVAEEKRLRGLGPKGTTIINEAPRPKIPMTLTDNISQRENGIAGALDLAQQIKQLARAYGGLDAIRKRSIPAQFKDVFEKEISAFGPDSMERRVGAAIQNFILAQQDTLIKGTPSDRDIKRLEQAVTGGKLSSLALIYDRAISYAESLRGDTLRYIKRVNKNSGSEIPFDDFMSMDTFKRNVLGEQLPGNRRLPSEAPSFEEQFGQ